MTQQYEPQEQPGGEPSSQNPPPTPGEEQGVAVAAHIGGLLTSAIVPLVLWLVYRDRSTFLAEQAKAALNWQLLLLPAYVIAVVLNWSPWLAVLGGLVHLGVFIVDAIFSVLSAVAAYQRQPHRYPVEVPIVR